MRIYDGANFCESCSACPVVEYAHESGVVRMSDPAKPERGSFTMTVGEYNALLTHAQKIV